MNIWQKAYSKLNNLWGDLQGYKRSQIRADAAAHALWEREALNEYSLGLFRERCRFAIKKFPQYAQKITECCGDDILQMDFLPSDIPVWTRKDMKKWFSSIDSSPIPGSWVHKTGGTSGSPVYFYVTRESYEWRSAVSDRGYSWANAQPGVKSVYIWGAPAVKPLFIRRVCENLNRKMQRRYFFDAFVMDERSMAECCALINKVKPEAIVGYAGCLAALASYVIREKNKLKHRARSIVTAAEALLDGQEELLTQALGDEVFRSYGSREFMLIGMECRLHRGYHISSDNLYVEVVDENGKPVADGEKGRILITDLHNDASPFVRYEIGDMGVSSGERCPCGLPFPLLEKVEGRIQEEIILPDGCRASTLIIPHLVKEFKWIYAYQFIQKTPDTFEINVVSDENLCAKESGNLVRLLKEKMGENLEFAVKCTKQLRRLPNGKTPFFVREEQP
mgnify:CR=1 FL=1